MKLLLDTHIWIWSLLEPEKLHRRVATALTHPQNEIWLSPISVWELLILAGRGKVALDLAPDEWVAKSLSRVPLREAALTRDVALATQRLRLTHRDPADRFLAATAVAYDLTLVTGDERLLRGEGYSTISNR